MRNDLFQIIGFVAIYSIGIAVGYYMAVYSRADTSKEMKGKLDKVRTNLSSLPPRLNQAHAQQTWRNN